MNTFLGLLIIAVGSFGQSSAYVPIRRVKQWSWESFWLVQGIFAWLVFPLAGALAAVAVYLRRREKELDEYERLLFGEDTAAPAEEEPAEAEDEAAEEAAPAEDTAE